MPLVEEFKCLWILFTSDGELEREVLRVLLQSVVVKRELSQNGHKWSQDLGCDPKNEIVDTI